LPANITVITMQASANIPLQSDIEAAAARIHAYVHCTPVLTSQNINYLAGADLFFKAENFQKAGAFKARGAHNAVFSLDQSEYHKGVATHSSGNHAAALSLAARNRGIPAFVVMPENSSKVKIAAVLSYGGKITFCKPTLQAREDTLKEVLAATGAVEVHPYNNPLIIAGQATAAKELTGLCPGLDTIIAPVGGGGLLSGTALAARYYSPSTTVIGAEPEGANDAFQSFYSGKLIPSVNPSTIADGLRTSLGSLTFPIIQEFVTGILTADDVEIIAAMKLVWERMKMIIEPSSAVALAVVLKNRERFAGKKVGIIISGGNVDLADLPWK
jgi:threonine dehydratase